MCDGVCVYELRTKGALCKRVFSWCANMSLIRVFALALLFDHAFGFLYKDLAVSSKRFKSIASDSYGIRWFALEESGHLWISSNGTRGWNKVESLECKNWTDVAVDDSGLNIVAVAEDIWFSRDGGGSWGKSTSISSTLQAQVASSARGSRVYTSEAWRTRI